MTQQHKPSQGFFFHCREEAQDEKAQKTENSEIGIKMLGSQTTVGDTSVDEPPKHSSLLYVLVFLYI
jgi:hypothetical protein